MSSHAPPGRPPTVSVRITVPLCYVIFFSVLNGMMFNVAIPDIAAEYGLTSSRVSWVMTAYVLVFGLGTLVYGTLADSLPMRLLITLGLCLLGGGSLLGFLAPGYPTLIAARLVQAGGGAAIPALAMMTAARYLPPEIRGRVLGTIASTVAFAAAVGPILGGFIAGKLHWRFLFLVIVPCVFAIPPLRRLLPPEEARRAPFDLRGALLLASAISVLLVSLTSGVWPLLLPGTILLLLFALHTARARDPLVPPSLLLNRPYRAVAAVTVLAMGSVFGMMFMVPIMLRDLNGLGASAIGLTLFPGAMAAAVMGAVGGRMTDRRGPPFVASLGMGLAASGFLLLSSVAGLGALVVAGALVVSYCGFAFLQSSLPHTAAAFLPGTAAGTGMGVYNLIFFHAGAFSAAAVGRALDSPPGGWCLNPFAACAAGRHYSNILLFLAAAAAAGLVLYRVSVPAALAAAAESGPDGGGCRHR